jgi:hypothetical protein
VTTPRGVSAEPEQLELFAREVIPRVTARSLALATGQDPFELGRVAKQLGV